MARTATKSGDSAGTPAAHSPGVGNRQIGDQIGAYRITALTVNGYQAVHASSESHTVLIEVWPGEGTHIGATIAEAAHVLGAIDHPGIAQIVNYGMQADGTPWMACEHAKGPAVHDLIVDRALRADKVAELIRDVAEVLRFAHENGVVHGRLRPHSIELAGDRVVISGWGITHRRAPSGYDAPESHFSVKADIYALAVIAFRALTGQLPRSGLTMHVPGAPPALAKLVVEMAAPDPANRPSAADVREAMAEMLGENAVISLDEIDDSDFASEPVPAFLELVELTRLPRPRWTPATHLSPVQGSVVMPATFDDDFET
jgi:serine/threonine protein kinase